MRISRSFVTRLLGILGIVYLCGCSYDDCSLWVTCDEVGVGVCVADPAAGFTNEGCGVFVSNSLGKDTNPGTRQLPVRTLAQAITLSQLGPARVYACAETFVEAAEVPPGVEIWGGLDCNHDWAYLGGKKTVIAPGTDRVPLRFLSGAGRSLVADVRTESANASQAGGSSIAAIVPPNAVVKILRSELIAGDGAPGMAGESGGDEPAMPGATGGNGDAACTADQVPGAPAVETMCENAIPASVGARGGDGNVNNGESGFDGQPEPPINPDGSGLGGTGETSSAVPCNKGVPGALGAPGKHGLGAGGPGFIGLEGWVGQSGKEGGPGRPGQGGGGGGGSRGGIAYCGALPKGGASGGAGGAGGCGGKGGMGGGYGGASIGLLTLTAEVTVQATTIVTGRGGDGGAGGLAQAGGIGGNKGLGGSGANGSLAGCEGGPGGDGGAGGRGGGGLGGPSIGIAYTGQLPAQDHVTIQIGTAGKGGTGDPAEPSAAGADGFASAVVSFPLPAGNVVPPGAKP